MKIVRQLYFPAGVLMFSPVKNLLEIFDARPGVSQITLPLAASVARSGVHLITRITVSSNTVAAKKVPLQ